jgi:hypothetical protein
MWTKIGFSIGQCIAAGNLCAKKRLKDVKYIFHNAKMIKLFIQ